MGLSTILSQINKKGKVQPKPVAAGETVSKYDGISGQRQASNRVDRPVDPVVARLKEKRRLEKEKAEQEARLKKGLPPKAPKSSSKTAKNIQKQGEREPRTSRKSTPVSSAPSIPPPPSQSLKPKKKMNFSELIKKASKIDQDKLSITFPSKNKSPEASGLKPHNPNKTNTTATKRDIKKPSPAPPKKVDSRPSPQQEVKQNIRAPLPVRQPSAKIQEKLKEKKEQHRKHKSREVHEVEDDDDDELSSFIASDEEEEIYEGDGGDYDRDEIWAIFNRGKKRSHYDRYDYDSADDMEATGAEILEEEYRSRRNAELEDRRELEEEKRLASLKRARLSKRS
ncbi:uncharacterized protein J8A68_005246 [[Candida] subhashii]|uniref:Protein SPT2 n=1 Tax=[Candida] subhashii TaxID=561895 RepID=A0A8J5UTU5_9ASCO|nr:uncharacterized protein J8A68_005246 [[Candida] subhashii]KAG7661250.1 hypothetical protein J8A68_005246 [[Candida] subhashii]